MTTPLLTTLEAMAARLDAGGPIIAGDAVDVRAAIAEIERLREAHQEIVDLGSPKRFAYSNAPMEQIEEARYAASISLSALGDEG